MELYQDLGIKYFKGLFWVKVNELELNELNYLIKFQLQILKYFIIFKHTVNLLKGSVG